MKLYYKENNIVLYHGDSRDINDNMFNNRQIFMLTDPPYGINYTAEKMHYSNALSFGEIKNDTKKFDLSFIFKWNCRLKIIFGANNFVHLLPHSGRWLCWDKRADEITDIKPRLDTAFDNGYGSQFELAWIDKEVGLLKMYRVKHMGFFNADRTGSRVHPTQKPVKLFHRILKDYYKEGDIIFDPFLGSGTTLLAARRLGIKAFGVELEEKYCEVIARRLSQIELF